MAFCIACCIEFTFGDICCLQGEARLKFCHLFIYQLFIVSSHNLPSTSKALKLVKKFPSDSITQVEFHQIHGIHQQHGNKYKSKESLFSKITVKS